MAWYAIGDVQGCYHALRKLVADISFNPDRDRLWFTGDLVNRGPDSLAVLRWVRDLRETATTVLGNHDLHLLALSEGLCATKPGDTLEAVLDAPDREELLDWLRRRPLLVVEQGRALLHAGLAPGWRLAQARSLAGEVEGRLRGDKPVYRQLLKQMYGNKPCRWDNGLSGVARHRVIINAFTRLRYCRADGHMGLRYKGPPGSQPPDYRPWYEYHRDVPVRFVFGHWSSHGDSTQDNAMCLDHGCVWGGRLTAVRLDVDPLRWYSVSCGSRPEAQQR